jgi:two-component system response regulator
VSPELAFTGKGIMPTVSARSPLAILAVEDDSAYVYVLRRVLDWHGFPYTLQVIQDGREALAFFDRLAQQADLPCPDVVLLDLHLPGCPGATLLQRFRAIPQCAGITVIIVTASDDPAIRTATLALGATAFFQKPTRFAAYMELVHLIQRYAAGHAPEG